MVMPALIGMQTRLPAQTESFTEAHLIKKRKEKRGKKSTAVCEEASYAQ